MQYDSQENDNHQQDMTYIPNRKKETIKIWLLTIILHLIIGLSLLAYWHFYHQPKQQKPTLSVQPDMTTTKSTAVIASIVASTTIASTTFASTTTTSQPKTVKTQQIQPTPQQQTTIVTDKPSQPTTPASTPTVAMTTTTTIERKTVVHEAPVTQALTDRDLPTSEKPKQSVAIAEKNKEATELSDDIDAKNRELSELINQVKQQNQQKISRETHNPFITQDSSQLIVKKGDDEVKLAKTINEIEMKEDLKE